MKNIFRKVVKSDVINDIIKPVVITESKRHTDDEILELAKQITQAREREVAKEVINAAKDMSDAIEKMTPEQIKDSEDKLIVYLKTKGFKVTPSGNIIQSTKDTLTDVGETMLDGVVDTGHFLRGMFRTVKNPIVDKIRNITELGS